MARRVLLCCALMDDPRVIVADEPTPGLDLPLALAALADFRSFADEGERRAAHHATTSSSRWAWPTAWPCSSDGTVVEETAVANFASPDTLAHPF